MVSSWIWLNCTASMRKLSNREIYILLNRFWSLLRVIWLLHHHWISVRLGIFEVHIRSNIDPWACFVFYLLRHLIECSWLEWCFSIVGRMWHGLRDLSLIQCLVRVLIVPFSNIQQINRLSRFLLLEPLLHSLSTFERGLSHISALWIHRHLWCTCTCIKTLLTLSCIEFHKWFLFLHLNFRFILLQLCVAWFSWIFISGLSSLIRKFFHLI